MSETVAIASPVETSPKVLKRRLTKKEFQEQMRLALLDSVKNHPDQWFRFIKFLSLEAIAVHHKGSLVWGTYEALLLDALLNTQMSDVQAVAVTAAVSLSEIAGFLQDQHQKAGIGIGVGLTGFL